MENVSKNEVEITSKVLWFSRHQMTDSQKEIFSNCEITTISGSPANVHVEFEGSVNGVDTKLLPLKEIVKDFDIIAIVLPIHLEQQVLGIAGNKPVIKAMTKRELIKVVFNFDGWKRIIKIEVIMEDFTL